MDPFCATPAAALGAPGSGEPRRSTRLVLRPRARAGTLSDSHWGSIRVYVPAAGNDFSLNDAHELESWLAARWPGALKEQRDRATGWARWAFQVGLRQRGGP